MAKQSAKSTQLRCEDVWLEISNYVDGEVNPASRRNLEKHFKTCPGCKSLVDGTQNVVRLLGAEKSLELPEAISRRLYSKLDQYLNLNKPSAAPNTISAGITGESVALGSHLIYFWQNEQDFEHGVRFFYPGLGKGEHCIAFGHDEALEHVLQVLRSNGYDPDRLIADRQLTVLRRQAKAQQTVSDIAAVMQGAVNAGTKAIRFLGNLGMGRNPLPGGEDDVVDLENRVSAVLSQVPSVVVCMYDVRTLSGRMILKGGLETHHLSVCHEGIHENPYFVGEHHSQAAQHIN